MKKKRTIIEMACLSLAGFVLLSGCGAADENLSEYRTQGIEQLQSGAYADAVESFTAALSDADADDLTDMQLDVMYYLALAQFKSGDTDAAVETYTTLTDADPESYQPYYLRASVYLQTEESEAAVADYKNAIELEGNDFDLYISIYENLADAGLSEEGAEILAGATDLSADSDEEKACAGYITYLLGDTEGAIEELNEAQDDGSDRALLYLGIIYAQTDQINTAQTYFDRYQEANESDSDALIELGTVALSSEAYELAINYYNEALSLSQESEEQYRLIQKNMIAAYEYSGDFEQAYDLLTSYIEMYPDDEEAANELTFVGTRLETDESEED